MQIAEKGRKYTSQESFKLKSPTGWWCNVAPLGEKPEWMVSDPPHTPQSLIFGHTWEQISAMQQKR